jgi:4-aminobutyrate aminotransferase
VTGTLADVWFKMSDLEVARGEGSWVFTVDGDRYLDFTCGIAVTNTGHCHPKVVKAIQEQAGRFIHAQVNIFSHDLLRPLAEGAVKRAKQATGRPHIVVVEGSFHGRTAMTMAMTTSKTSYRAGHSPLPSGVFVAPFPDHYASGESSAAAVDRCIAGLEWLLKTQTAPSETAAIVIEPVLGEGGYVPAPAGYLEAVESICRRHGILLILDEIQSGFGRTGRMFATEHHQISPDIMTMAKGIASGFPIAAIGARADLMDRWPVGSHGGTYGGNPIGCAAALATIEVITEPGFLDNVVARGDQLRAGLTRLSVEHPGMSNVRGPGLMVGADFVTGEGTPDADRCNAIIRHCREESRLLLMGAGARGNTIRFMPPLIVDADQVDLGLEALGKALSATA